MTIQTGKIRTFELIVNVSSLLEGTIDDWPSNIQDGIYEAMERKADEVGLPLAIVHSGCEHDIDEGYYIRVIISEVVMGDDRVVGDGSDGFVVNAPSGVKLH